jgi:hypothetical protein
MHSVIIRADIDRTGTVSRVPWNFRDDPCELCAAAPTVAVGAAMSG